jgi:A/G-specific adenine glycosylase
MERCRARQQGTVSQLPVKLRRVSPVKITSELLVIQRGRRVLLRQREAQSRRMAGFWDLPSAADLPDAQTSEVLGEFRHTITHHHYTFTVRSAAVRKPGRGYGWFSPAQLSEIPLSTIARKGLRLAVFTNCESFVKHGAEKLRAPLRIE